MTWIVVSTHAHKEAQASSHLIRQGFSIYSPVLRKAVRHARRTQSVLRPLFTGYLFVESILEPTWWRPIASTVGVRGIIKHGDAPANLDDDFIAALRAREVDGVIARPSQPFAIGQHVRLSSGPFDGFAAKIIELSDRDRVIVLLDLLNQQVKATVTLDKISPV